MDFSQLPYDLKVQIVGVQPAMLRLRSRELKDLADVAAANELRRAAALFAATHQRVLDQQDQTWSAEELVFNTLQGRSDDNDGLYSAAVKTFDLHVNLLVKESRVFAQQLEAVYQDWGWHPLLGGLVGTHTLNLCWKLGYRFARPMEMMKLRERIMNRFTPLVPSDAYTNENGHTLTMHLLPQEVQWDLVFNALLADMRAKNQVWASKNLLPHRIEDNDLEWWE